MKKEKTGKLRIILIPVILVAAIVAAVMIFHYGMGLGTWKGTSFEDYEKRAYRGFFYEELPAGAEDFRYYAFNMGLGANSSAAFTLKGQDYDDFAADISEMDRGSVQGYTDEKLDYTGMKVSETANYRDNYDKYIGFPLDKFGYVIDDDISDYTILYYNAYDGAGSEIHAIAANPETGRIVIYNYGTN